MTYNEPLFYRYITHTIYNMFIFSYTGSMETVFDEGAIAHYYLHILRDLLSVYYLRLRFSFLSSSESVQGFAILGNELTNIT